jgi:non-specific serine/threonine protein kinase
MSSSRARVTYRFGEFEVDTAALELRHAGRRVALTRQAMDCLFLLLERRQELVSRDDLAKRLWAENVFTDSDAGIHTAILKIRQALGDSRAAPRYVETMPGRGYRFIAAVEVVTQPFPAAPPVPIHNLPAELTSFVGRHKELLELPGVLASARLLSVTGAGGVGKTRLALRLAGSVASAFPDGVWLVDLAPLAVPGLVPQTIATVLGIRENPQQSVRDALLDHLRHRTLLLVLDNCEHLIATCAELVESLLRGAPQLRIVATSREALGVPGETICRTPSLSVPEVTSVSPDMIGAHEATQLFVERAIAVDPHFAPTTDNATAIASICRRLDGIPLAIELAAARIVVLSPQQIEARLQDRFRLLAGGARTAVARQRTLEATVDWSYDQLSDDERQLLIRLSVFPASWTLEAAEHVCGGEGLAGGDVLDLLSRLVAKSLVVVDSELDRERRYRFLETVRQYSLERLTHAGAAERLRGRHCEFYFNEFRASRPILCGHGQLAMLRRLRLEQENVRAALEWALTSPPLAEKGVELAGALFWFWTKRSQFEEGSLWLERAIAAGECVSPSLRARAQLGLANIYYFRRIESGPLVAEALSLASAAGDAWAVSFALFIQSLTALERGAHDEAVACALRARDAASAGGEAVEHSGPLLWVLGYVAGANGDHDRAQQLYDESIDVSRRAGETWGLGILLLAAAASRMMLEDHGRAHAQASEALSLFQELEDPRGIAWSLEVFAGLMAAAGHADTAARLWSASEEMLQSMGASLPPNIKVLRERYIGPVKAALNGTRYDAACVEGRTMPLEQAIAHVRRETDVPTLSRRD